MWSHLMLVAHEIYTTKTERDLISRKANRDRLQKQLKLDIIISYSKVCIARLIALMQKGFYWQRNSCVHAHFLLKSTKEVPWGRLLKIFGHSKGHNSPTLRVNNGSLPNSDQQNLCSNTIYPIYDWAEHTVVRASPADMAPSNIIYQLWLSDCALFFSGCVFHMAVQPFVMNPGDIN